MIKMMSMQILCHQLDLHLNNCLVSQMGKRKNELMIKNSMFIIVLSKHHAINLAKTNQNVDLSQFNKL